MALCLVCTETWAIWGAPASLRGTKDDISSIWGTFSEDERKRNVLLSVLCIELQLALMRASSLSVPRQTREKKKHRLDRKDGDDGHLWLQLWPHRHIFERLDDKLLECPAVSQSGSKTWLTAVEHNRNVILIWAVGTAALAWEIIQALIAEADPNSEGSNQTHTLVHTVKQIGTINGSLRSNTLDLWVSVELSYHNRRYVCVNFTLWSHMPG